MLSLPACPLRHTFRVSAPAAPSPQHASCFHPRAAPRLYLAPSNKKPDSKTCCRGQSQRLCGATPLDTASLPHPLIDCQHSQASYASFTSSATRHLSPRPSGAHIIGFGPCRHHTIADSLSVRLPFSSRQRFVKLFLCYHRIFPLSTDFDPLFQIFRPIKPQRAPSAHPCAHRLMRTLYYCCPAPPDKFSPVRFTQMPSAPAQAPFPRTAARAVRKRHAFNKRESGWRRKHMRKTTGGSA